MLRTWRRFWNMDETRHPHDPRFGHETTDVNVWAVGKFAIALVVMCVISLALLWGLLRYFQSEQATSMATTVEPTGVFCNWGCGNSLVGSTVVAMLVACSDLKYLNRPHRSASEITHITT